MKWFQHEVHFHNDEKIRELIHKKGLEAYGFLNLIYELISEKIDSKMEAKLVINSSVIAEKARMKRVKTQLLSSLCADLSLFAFSCDGEYFIYECPNLLKRLDNWTKRSVVTTEQVSPNKNKKENNNKNKKKKEKEESVCLDEYFEEIWSRYPKAVGKKHAKRHFHASVKGEDDYVRISKALNNYCASKNVRNGFIKNGSTWFNEWEDWVNYNERSVESAEERDKRILEELSK